MDRPSEENPSTSTSTSTSILSPPPLNQPQSFPPPSSSSTPSEKPTSLPPSNPPPSPTSSIPAHLTHLTRILSTTNGLSTTLQTLTYTLHLLHSRLLPLSTPRLAPNAPSSAQTLSSPLASAEKLLPPPPTRLSRTIRSLRASTALLDDTRLFLRLWGLLSIYAWGKTTHANPPRDAWLRRIAYLQVLVNALYQVLENGAYLASHQVFRWPEAKVKRWYVWSARFWMGHVGLEGCRLGREWVLRRRVVEGRGGRAEEVGVKMERVRAEGRWWREVVVNAAWAPLTLHWSVEGGVVGDGVVAGLGMVAGWVEMGELWRRTA